ncbi:predicted protein [Nematostella vectensis]|uniref:G-protein coupled receptors family 2 profile 2 domain-containing protein n=1 Tax=Nematostella vectensis TaxID=45351 RepID=A7S3G9_NEMVE|nr:predicted protein [Nematostella vectensis]|eukprot:XP_001633786.1 predicted protein [Nematostella vectensis]
MAVNNSTTLQQASHIEVSFPVFAVTITSCGLSTLGSLVQIITYYLWRDLQIPSRKLLVFIAVSDLCTALSLGLGAVMDFHETSSLCLVQAFVSTYFSASSLFWMSSLMVYVLVTVITVDPEKAGKLIKYFHVLCWSIPALMCISALLYSGFGETDNTLSTGWCWVKYCPSDTWMLFWILVTQKLWEMSAYIGLVALCIAIKINIQIKCAARSRREIIPKGTAVAMQKFNKKVFFVPFLFILLRVWGTVRAILALQQSRYQHSQLLMALQGAGDTGQGFVNFILFCVCTARTRHIISSELTDSFNRSYTWLTSWRIKAQNSERKPLLRNNSNRRMHGGLYERVSYSATSWEREEV